MTVVHHAKRMIQLVIKLEPLFVSSCNPDNIATKGLIDNKRYNPRHIKLGHSVQHPYSDKKLCSFPPSVEVSASVMLSRRNQH